MLGCSTFYCYVQCKSSRIASSGNSIIGSSSPVSKPERTRNLEKTWHGNWNHGPEQHWTWLETGPYQIGLSSSTRVFKHWPDSASQMRLLLMSEWSRPYMTNAYISPSIAQDTTRVPSWLKPTAVTGSEWAGRTFKSFAGKQWILSYQIDSASYLLRHPISLLSRRNPLMREDSN